MTAFDQFFQEYCVKNRLQLENSFTKVLRFHMREAWEAAEKEHLYQPESIA